MGKLNFKIAFISAIAVCTIPGAVAKTGAPHTLNATSTFDEVTITWQAPDAAKELKWHDGTSYDGDDVEPASPQTHQRFYAGALFTAADLVYSVGETIEAVSFFQYRPAFAETIVIFENGVKVSETAADPSKFVKNTWQKVDLTKPVTIKANTDYRIAILWEAGSTSDLVAIKDHSTLWTGRGDQFSLDGVNWVSTANGSYLVTVHLANDVDESPTSYDIYRDGTKIDSSTGTSAVLSEQPGGDHLYSVHAIYTEATHASYEFPVHVRLLESTLPTVSMSTPTVSDLDVFLSWAAPIKGGDTLTWNDAEYATGFGGTAKSNTKIWIKNEFESTDLIGYMGGQIKTINAYFSEDCINAVTAWVMCNGTIIASKQVNGSIGAGWLSVTLDEPVTIEPGNKYAYGLYVLHASGRQPIGIGGSTSIIGKGNEYSTTNPQTSFATSKPSFKTLTQQGIEGNWMLTADIANSRTPISSDFTYDVYRDGTLVKSGVTETRYTDTVEDLGRYVYSVVTRNAAGLESDHAKTVVNVALPEVFAAPTLKESEFDTKTRTVTLNWNTDNIITKAGDLHEALGFEEERTMHWGQQFTAEELAAYEGQYIKGLSIVVGEGITNLKVGVYTTNGTPLSELDLNNATSTLIPYVVSLPEPVAITGTQDLILAYSGTLAAHTTQIYVDKGPNKTNGARVSLDGGATWMDLGSLKSDFNNYNIIIGANVGEPESKQSPARAAKIKAAIKSFNVYRNGVVVANTTAKTYTETLDKFNVFKYYITAVYDNGFESAASDSYIVHNRIDQRTIAPYGLEGSLEGDNLTLTWQVPGAATTLTYVPENDETIEGFGQTGSGPRTSYIINKFSVETLEPYVGDKIDHIQFGLSDVNITSLSVIVLIGENIVYTQSVPTSEWVVGINDVRLNEPYEIPAGAEVSVGFVTEYVSGLKPIALASNASVEGYSDLFSVTGTPGYWNTLKSRMGVDRSFWIKAILSTNDQIVKAKAAQPKTYNVYYDGTLIAEGVTEPTYTVENATTGTYYVTAIDAEGNESGTSNKVIYSSMTSVEDIVVAEDTEADYFDLNGRRVEPEAGTIVIRRQGNSATKVIIK